MIKSRNICFEETLKSLENEYISAKIRSQIYTLTQDIKYWGRVVSAKREKIKSLGLRKGLKTMFDDYGLEQDVINRVVPIFGFPHFTYNEKFHEEGVRFTFPYSGTVVQVPGGEYGHSDYVDNNKIQVRMVDNSFRTYNLFEVRRLSPLETDMYYYYIVGSKFKTFSSDSCVLKRVDFNKKRALLSYQSEGVMLEDNFSFNEISRIL